MAASFERIAGAKEENTIFGSITRFWESPFRHLLVKEEAPQYLKTIRAILSSDEIINPTPNQVAGFIGGINSHKTDPDCEPGEHWIYDEERYSMPSRNRGLESAATDEGEARGTHVKRNGVGTGVEKTMSMSARALESAATDEGEARGTHVKRNGVGAGVEKTMSMSARSLKGSATDEGEARGTHVKRKGVGAGVEKTMC
jgi:hypothetical protein